MQREKVKKLPNLFTFSGFKIYFWSNEGSEPIHVHVQKWKHTSASAKFWLLSNGTCELANNKAQLSSKQIRILGKFITVNFEEICDAWKKFFNEDSIKFYK